jgi:hypothetical protein
MSSQRDLAESSLVNNASSTLLPGSSPISSAAAASALHSTHKRRAEQVLCRCHCGGNFVTPKKESAEFFPGCQWACSLRCASESQADELPNPTESAKSHNVDRWIKRSNEKYRNQGVDLIVAARIPTGGSRGRDHVIVSGKDADLVAINQFFMCQSALGCSASDKLKSLMATACKAGEGDGCARVIANFINSGGRSILSTCFFRWDAYL